MRKAKLTLAGLGLAGLVGLGFAVPALAQDDDAATTTPSPSSRAEERAAHEADFAERLAAVLGLETKRVQDALATVREELLAEAKAGRLAGLKERLDQAVEDKKLTREEADAILEAAEKGVLPGGPGFGGHGGHHGRGPGFGFGNQLSADVAASFARTSSMSISRALAISSSSERSGSAPGAA
jgi:hypothetical protein